MKKKIMSGAKNPDEFYDKLKTQLQETSLWPSEYLYKFIVPTKPGKIESLEDIFDNMGAVISKKKSKNGNYTSISVNVRMKSAEAVIAKYKEVGNKIDEVISL